VASGVESEPGRKDPARLEEFFAAARSAAPGVAAA
jgi:phosphoribosylanthranilate isomerase